MRYRGSLVRGVEWGITLSFCAPVPPPNAIRHPGGLLPNHVRGSKGEKMDLVLVVVLLLLPAQSAEGKCRRREREISIWTKARWFRQ